MLSSSIPGKRLGELELSKQLLSKLLVLHNVKSSGRELIVVQTLSLYGRKQELASALRIEIGCSALCGLAAAWQVNNRLCRPACAANAYVKFASAVRQNDWENLLLHGTSRVFAAQGRHLNKWDCYTARTAQSGCPGSCTADPSGLAALMQHRPGLRSWLILVAGRQRHTWCRGG